MTRSGRMTRGQMELLLEAMYKNRKLALGRHQGSVPLKIAQGQWNALSLQLNADSAGPKKNGKSWKKAWTDWKGKTKAKAAKLGDDIQGPGGSPASQIVLSDLELRLMDLIGFKCVTEKVFVQEGGFQDSFVNANMEVTPQQSSRAIDSSAVPDTPDPAGTVTGSDSIQLEFIDLSDLRNMQGETTSTSYPPQQPRQRSHMSSVGRQANRSQRARLPLRAGIARKNNRVKMFEIENRRLEIEKIYAEAKVRHAEAENSKAAYQKRKLELQEAQLKVTRELVDELREIKDVMVAKFFDM